MADSVGAEGGTAFGFDQNPPAENSYTGPTDNIVQNVNVASVATKGDSPASNDSDYDDPYPGGSGTYTLLPAA